VFEELFPQLEIAVFLGRKENNQIFTSDWEFSSK
jgi:hypothetical protein